MPLLHPWTLNFIHRLPVRRSQSCLRPYMAVEEPACQNPTPIPISCGDSNCHANAGYASYRLEIQFSDGKTRQSNVFQNTSAHTVYKVTICPDNLIVETQSTSGYQSSAGLFNQLAIICVCLAGILVLVILLIVFLIRRSRKKK